MTTKTNRRNFIRTTAAAGAGILGAPAILHAENKGDKLRVAFIGVGGINSRHINDTRSHGDICGAYCDVDSGRWDNIPKSIKKLEKDGKTELAKHWKAAKGFQDYREMFEKAAGQFDAVMIGTPDHTHFPATVMALNHGKHVFTQKPLTHTVWEARQLALATDKYKLATQMGNHGHANEGNRLIAAYVQGGHLGDIKEVHCFTNRPIWPQGFVCPEGEDEIPDTLDWTNWLGCAKRPTIPRQPRARPEMEGARRRLPAIQLARLARLRGWCPRRHGVPYHGLDLHVAEPGIPDPCRGTQRRHPDRLRLPQGLDLEVDLRGKGRASGLRSLLV